MTKEELKNAGVDLWLLGHIHVPWPDKPGGRDTILYSGTPEPDTANCPHKGTALLIEIEGNKSISIDRLKTGTYKFERWREEVTSFTDLEKLADRVKKEENANSVCRLSIKGVLDPEDYHRWQDEILPGLKDSFLYLRINDLELRKRITIDQLYDIYPEESFPTHLLSGFIEEDDQDALQTAYDLLEEVKDEN
jgi:DNA repair exonuclease SbcCD nuclease subunit